MNQGLVDDGLVEKEKIGGSNYFWSFPGKKDRMMQIKHEQNLTLIEKMKENITEASAQLADAKRGREDENGDRPAKLQKLADLKLQKRKVLEELEKLKENDPQALADLEKEYSYCKTAAERWTDNIFNCQTYLVKKKGVEKKEARKLLGITDAFDCKFNLNFQSFFVSIQFVKILG